MSYRLVVKKTDSPIFVNLSKIVVWTFGIVSIIAMLVIPGYNIKKNYLSALGTHGQMGILFNLLIMLTAVLLIPTFITVYKYLKPSTSGKTQLYLILAVGLGIISMVSLFFVGYFPANPPTRDLHNLLASIFFSLLTFSIAFLSLTVARASREVSPEYYSPWDYAGFAFIPLVIVFANKHTWYSILLQKFIVYSALLFLLYILERIHQIPLEKDFYYAEEEFNISSKAYTVEQVIFNNRVF